MQPRQSFETFMPVLPNFTESIAKPPTGIIVIFVRSRQGGPQRRRSEKREGHDRKAGSPRSVIGDKESGRPDSERPQRYARRGSGQARATSRARRQPSPARPPKPTSIIAHTLGSGAGAMAPGASKEENVFEF